MRAPTRYQNR